jgi:hypothetical protein
MHPAIVFALTAAPPCLPYPIAGFGPRIWIEPFIYQVELADKD